MAEAERAGLPVSESLDASSATPVAVVTDPAAAGALLSGPRRQVLEHLRTPGSATTAAAALGLSRQRVNYHVRALERAGLIEEVGRRRRRGLEERIVRATASRFLIAPDAHRAGPPADDHPGDAFSAAYQLATAARTIREVAALAEGARKAGKRLTTLTLDTELSFANPAARQAFAEELVQAVNTLVAKYHAPDATDGRRYRLFAGAHPTWVPPDSRSPQ